MHSLNNLGMTLRLEPTPLLSIPPSICLPFILRPTELPWWETHGLILRQAPIRVMEPGTRGTNRGMGFDGELVRSRGGLMIGQDRKRVLRVSILGARFNLCHGDWSTGWTFVNYFRHDSQRGVRGPGSQCDV
jgi:hypothetical protein